jgi:hypothetical protein
MDRVGGDVRVTVAKGDIDNDQVVNVVQVISNLGCSEFSAYTSNNEITSSTICDLVCNMIRDMELTISPMELKLYTVRQSDGLNTTSQYLHALYADRCLCVSCKTQNPQRPRRTRW